jgi:hypothetical protein
MTKKNTKILAIGIIFGVLGFASKLLYRPLIITNDINDIGINEFAPSFFYTAGLCLIGASFSKKKPQITMILIALGSTAYELEQIFTDNYFDIKDLIAIMFALLISFLIFKKVESKENSFNETESQHH